MIAFYAKATTDDLIGEFFTEVVPFDLRHHLPVIGDFWESVLLGTQAYRAHNRSPLQLHAELDALQPLHRSISTDGWSCSAKPSMSFSRARVRNSQNCAVE